MALCDFIEPEGVKLPTVRHGRQQGLDLSGLSRTSSGQMAEFELQYVWLWPWVASSTGLESQPLTGGTAVGYVLYILYKLG
jgi:hypothetical protein